MPTIGAAVDAQTKATFEAIARGRTLTPSRLAGSLITEFIRREQGAPTDPPAPAQPSGGDRDAARTRQVFVRLAPYYYAELLRLADERNWYPGTYMGNLFAAHADRRPVLCDAEIEALRNVARYLADLGRNVNQIARKINSSPEHLPLAATLEIDVLQALLELEKKTVNDLVRANLKGWGMSDGEQ